jgi:Protein of unknown function (DUF1592)/Protein of unknown function (DUF1588)/Protein of unknown function (DUF1587)/Protein of unknown function (DUF1595)/Protein of unknown function (DUF1585)
MLGLKLGRRIGRNATAWLAPGLAVALVGCSSGSGPASNMNPGAGGTGTGGTSMTSGGTTVTPPGSAPQVGLVTLRRLNRTEYGNTLRDLVGTTTDYSTKYPAENLSYGFDNIGEALTVQPFDIEQHEHDADAILAELFARPATDPVRQRIISCDAASGGRTCMTQMLLSFAQYAYRRPVVEAEVSGLVDIAQDFVMTGGTVNDALQVAFKGVLLSPHFIYKVELDQDPTSKTPHRLSGFELATRLSYYLWSTTPDQTLLVDAQMGKLATDAGLTAEVERMLTDPRASALITNFVGQWLYLRRAEAAKPDATVFPTFDAELSAALRIESEKFVNELFQQGKPIAELLTGTFTYVNPRLAKHYGLPVPAGTDFTRVDLTGTQRTGFLMQASFLTALSNPTRTSPVKRGKWVLEQLLCAPPPPPPPGVDTKGVDSGTTSVRARLEAHRAKEPCKSCHAVMDPIGLSFENFDGIGTYRSADQYGPIDATGTLTTAKGDVSFQGAAQLLPILAADDRLAGCVAQKVLTYAVGRGFSGADEATLTAVAGATNTSGKGLRGLFASVAISEAFRSRVAVAP